MYATIKKLREATGLTQVEFAKLIERSPATIHSLEAKEIRLKLSPDLADRISWETGISATWLLNNNIEAPMVRTNGKPWSKAEFDSTRANNQFGGRVGVWFVGTTTASLYLEMLRVMAKACKEGRHHIALYKFVQAIQSIAEEIGRDEDLFSKELLKEIFETPDTQLPSHLKDAKYPRDFKPRNKKERLAYDLHLKKIEAHYNNAHSQLFEKVPEMNKAAVAFYKTLKQLNIERGEDF